MYLVFLLVVACAARYSSGQNVEGMPQYDQRYDYLDVDGILDSKRLVKNYVDCLINVKPCTPEGKALKRVLPEALRTKCARCSERQKRVAVKVIRRMKSEYPREWAELAARWDPTGDFSAYFERVLAKEHFNTIAGNNNEVQPSRRPVQPLPAAFPAPFPVPAVAVAAPAPPPPPPTPPPATAPPSTVKPLLLNRFGDDDEAMPSNAQPPSSLRPVVADMPTAIPWDSGTPSPAPSNPTRFTYRPPFTYSPPEIDPIYDTTVTLIDHFGNKIIKTTELVADILRNTVRALGG